MRGLKSFSFLSYHPLQRCGKKIKLNSKINSFQSKFYISYVYLRMTAALDFPSVTRIICYDLLVHFIKLQLIMYVKLKNTYLSLNCKQTLIYFLQLPCQNNNNFLHNIQSLIHKQNALLGFEATITYNLFILIVWLLAQPAPH